MASQALKIDVLLVSRFRDEHDVEWFGTVRRVADVALLLLPVLKRRGDEVDVKAMLDEHARKEPEPIVTFRLVSQLDSHGDNGDFLCGRIRVHAYPFKFQAREHRYVILQRTGVFG